MKNQNVFNRPEGKKENNTTIMLNSLIEHILNTFLMEFTMYFPQPSYTHILSHINGTKMETHSNKEIKYYRNYVSMEVLMNS